MCDKELKLEVNLYIPAESEEEAEKILDEISDYLREKDVSWSIWQREWRNIP